MNLKDVEDTVGIMAIMDIVDIIHITGKIDMMDIMALTNISTDFFGHYRHPGHNKRHRHAGQSHIVGI